MEMNRRTLLGAAALPLAAALPARAADDWDAVAAHYDVTRDVIQLEHGNWGLMPRPVLAEYRAQLDRVNRETSFYARRTMPGDIAAARARLAAAMGVGVDEIAFTRNATEALKTLILGYNRLRPGDGVLMADLDYDSMQACVAALASRRGVTVAKIALPEPATYQGLIDAYAAAFDANPRLRMVLLTHVSHRTGLVLPVAEIARMARARGIDAIVDAAHGVGQIDVTLPALEADFIGINVHKWLGAPLGVGALYIKRGRVADIDPDPAEPADAPLAIHTRVHTGTVDFAAQLTVPAALDFQQAIGGAAREARLRLLRDRWVDRVRDLPGIQVLTPPDPRLHCAITSFRLTGRTTRAENMALARTLLDQHRIFTVHRDGLASGSCVRVTPALMTRLDEVDTLADALRTISRA
ncbi:penicillin epimerase [Sphingomonas hengshuiensis]|uniref:Penicillin epimerase n=2 Tax=Sphingomonas hengshuiensis TaxID=1609977 RepID=A0A7U5BEW6_9SPHN|nr:penicillin epimerase [Sphingomonas hengshuiensis]